MMKMKPRYLFVLILLLLANVSFATQDRMATTYHLIAHPDDGIVPFPVSFITFNSIPETEINAIDSPNKMEQRDNALTNNANLISLYRIKVNVVEHSSSTGTVVLVDLSNMTTPTNRQQQASQKAVVQGTIKCVTLCAERIGVRRLEIRIKPPPNEQKNSWKKLEQVIFMRKEDDK